MCVEIVVLLLEVALEVDSMAVFAHNVTFLCVVAMMLGTVSTYDIPIILLSDSVLVVMPAVVASAIKEVARMAGYISVLLSPGWSHAVAVHAKK